MKQNVEMVIENIVDATLGKEAMAREKHVFRESLRNLVRLAKSEQMLEIKENAKKLTGKITASASRRKSKIDDLVNCGGRPRQRQLEFGLPDGGNSTHRHK
jgi:hypothetical protein